jgi:TnpA family transposase
MSYSGNTLAFQAKARGSIPLIRFARAFIITNDLANSFAEYGRMIKTIFILRYLMNQPYRRKINSQLNIRRKITRFTPISLFCSSRCYSTAT